ncbi:MAG: ATPase domain-containing protein [Longimicrobiales bacterium]
MAGGPGAGKTTLSQQIVFANASDTRPALYFTVLGEPTLKMLRYQAQFDFFDPALVGSAVQFINLSEEALEQDLGTVLERIVKEVESAKPGIVVVDSFRTIAGRVESASVGAMAIDEFVQRLALHLTTWEVTSLLLGEYAEQEQRFPVFTVADGVLWLSQATDRNSVVRKLQVLKSRGRAPMPGLHTFRITDAGLQVFPRIPEQQQTQRPQSPERLGTGVPGLDEMMGGGIPVGDVVMIAGPAGSGKTTFATQFAASGLHNGEAVVIAVFEEYPEEYMARAASRDQAIKKMVDAGKLKVMYLRPLDLSVDETLTEILDSVEAMGATRVVIDSLSGLEVALAPAFREDFRESLYRLVGALTASGVTVVMTAEIIGNYPDVRFTTEKVSFITDDIIVQRLVEMDGQLRKVLTVVKMRGSEHSRNFRIYDITAKGAVIGGPLANYHGIITGVPELQLAASARHAGLTQHEVAVFDMLVRAGSMPRDLLAARLGLPVASLDQPIERLVALGFVRAGEDGTDTYRAVAQPE